ncbi:MAG: RNA polymerase sigma factor [Alphaproteobacteria bacterium]|nr:RNA polymerase sigma factor [Alphaproteobacteria bacterium]
MTKRSPKSEKLTQDQQWSAWAAAAQQGDKKAYNNLLRDIAPYIRAVIAPTLADPDWADDITQNVLISVHKSLSTYSPKRSFKPWLNAITNFRRTDFLRCHYSRRKDKQTSLEDPNFIRNHVTNPAHAGEYKDIEGALAALPKKQRKIFEMIKIQGYTAKEVAKEMGMSVSAVKVSAHRTSNQLKEKLG